MPQGSAVSAAGALSPAAAGDFLDALTRMGLLPAGAPAPAVFALAGGVSSDIVRVDLPGGAACVKRALPRLKVKADWQAPVERNRWEVEWMRIAGRIEPDAVPRILGEDADAGMFAMAYLDEASHPVWKALLRDGQIEAEFAAGVGRRIAHIHAATAGDAQVRDRFATDHIFFPIRLEPYLVATGRAHPDLAPRLERLAERTRANHLALVHGDVSPKNILRGPHGPVFLDAECAWYGDPAFDLAFCLNHMLLKCLWRPQWSPRYLACFDALASAYLAGVTWEPRGAIDARTASLLPGLFLARVDGKSPAEYLTQDWQRDAVRRVARPLLLQPPDSLGAVAQAWRLETGRWNPKDANREP
jgi:aminoglycoside phosphotransferase (APT) family kinase protein